MSKVNYGWRVDCDDYYFHAVNETIKECCEQAKADGLKTILISNIIGEYIPVFDGREWLEDELERADYTTDDIDDISDATYAELEKEVNASFLKWKEKNHVFCGWLIGKEAVFDVETMENLDVNPYRWSK